ncbi:MAG: hypothetical protein FWC43_01965 [Planctomycetaceae bacterium]|nr:hypothetical protein [Planctomycetaceae bacterium]
MDKDAGQATIWHLNNGMSWEQLAAKTRTQPGQPKQPYFTPRQLMVAQNIVGEVVQYFEVNESDLM